MSDKVAIVTGANRGLGFQISKELAQKGFQVVLCSRDSKKGEQATAELAQAGLKVDCQKLDVAEDKSVARLKDYIASTYGRCDVLVNNAGVFLEKRDRAEIEIDLETASMAAADFELMQRIYNINVFGVIRLCNAFIPMMRQQSYGRIVNMSSGMGQLEEMGMGYPGYRLSKTSLNAATKILAVENKKHNILINAVCPGWVKTDMGGSGASRTIAEGAETPVWLTQLPDGAKTGGFFRDKKEMPW